MYPLGRDRTWRRLPVQKTTPFFECYALKTDPISGFCAPGKEFPAPLEENPAKSFPQFICLQRIPLGAAKSIHEL